MQRNSSLPMPTHACRYILYWVQGAGSSCPSVTEFRNPAQLWATKVAIVSMGISGSRHGGVGQDVV